jgi:hypothetical protein
VRRCAAARADRGGARVLDLTGGERGSWGTRGCARREAAAAAGVLGSPSGATPAAGRRTAELAGSARPVAAHIRSCGRER